ncbi:hypothetical protein REPUB_Repub10bG0011200 [Reevesia pubescens]
MAPNSSKRDDDSLYFTSKTPHFFKVLQTDAIQQGKLKIPGQFVRKYGSGISSPVFLKVPSGEIWQVELTKSNAEIWLQSGWKEFVKHHCLEFQDFVVFRYEGNCLFNVVIFDKGASEIEYPIISNQAGNLHFNGKSQGSKTEEDDHDSSVEILDDMPVPLSKKRREKSPLPCPRPSRKMRAYSNANRTESNAMSHTLASKHIGIKVSDNRFKVPKGNGSSPWHTQGFTGRGSIAAKKSYGEMNDSQKYRHRRMQNTKVRGMEKAKALQRASSFKSQNPFFTTVIQPSYVKLIMNIPNIFARQYLMQKHAKVLCVIEGKTWSMEYNNASKQFNPSLGNGWKEFSHDNKLDVGDVCVFELVKGTEIRFNVVVFRSEVADSCQSLDDENGASRVKSNKSVVTNYASRSKGASSSLHNKLAAQNSKLPRGTFNQVRHKKTAGSQDTQEASLSLCKVLVRSCYLVHRRYIMADTGTRMVTLQVAERSWPVKLKSYGSKCCLTGGWSVFAKENSLRADDLCVFELINRSDAVLRVSIFKHEDDENGASRVKSNKSMVTNYASRGNFNQVRHKKTAGSKDNTEEASSVRTLGVFEASSNFVPKDPHCKVLVRSYYLIRWYLSLPVAFSRRYIMADTGTRMVTLQVAERSWPVKLRSNGSRCCLTGGWSVFAKENSLRADDLCVFELINRSDAVMRVSIFKHEDNFFDPSFEIFPCLVAVAPTPSLSTENDADSYNYEETTGFDVDLHDQASNSLMTWGYIKTDMYLGGIQLGSYSGMFLPHVVPTRLLSWEDLSELNDGASLSTFAKGFMINVTKSGHIIFLNDVFFISNLGIMGTICQRDDYEAM